VQMNFGSRACASGDARYRSFLFANFGGVGAANEVCAISPAILSAVSTCVLVESCARWDHSPGGRSQCVAIQLNWARRFRKPSHT
jgi:hypothetical protein